MQLTQRRMNLTLFGLMAFGFTAQSGYFLVKGEFSAYTLGYIIAAMVASVADSSPLGTICSV